MLFYVSYISKSYTAVVSSVQVYLSLLRMYLSPPDAHCLGPIKMELSEPQANLQAALQVLELHHSKLNTTKVRISLASRMTSVVVEFCCQSVLVERFGSMFQPLIKYKHFLWLYSSLYYLTTSSCLSEADTCAAIILLCLFVFFPPKIIMIILQWHFQTASHIIS